jgi:hypothetical protein
LVEKDSFIVPPMNVPILGFEVPSKFSNSTAPGTEDVVAPGVTEIVTAYDGVLVKVNASNDRPSVALNFDFMTVTPLNRRSRDAHAAPLWMWWQPKSICET